MKEINSCFSLKTKYYCIAIKDKNLTNCTARSDTFMIVLYVIRPLFVIVYCAIYARMLCIVNPMYQYWCNGIKIISIIYYYYYAFYPQFRVLSLIPVPHSGSAFRFRIPVPYSGSAFRFRIPVLRFIPNLFQSHMCKFVRKYHKLCMTGRHKRAQVIASSAGNNYIIRKLHAFTQYFDWEIELAERW